MKRSWLDSLLYKLNKHGEASGFPYILFSLYQILNYLLLYPAWLWQTGHYNFPFWHLHIISFASFFLLSLKKYWFKNLKKYYVLCWCVAITWALPTSNTIFLLRNYNHITSSITDCIIALFTLALIVDWLSFTIILLTGISTAVMVQYITNQTIYISASNLAIILSNCGWVIFVCILFSHNAGRFRRNLQLEKQLSAIKTVCASIAHELRTPLLAIKSGAGGVALYLPKLITTYRTAVKHDLDVPKLHPRTLEHIEEVINNIESEVNFSNTIIDTLLTNASQNVINPDVFVQHTIKNCVESAILRFPFSPAEKIDLIHFDKHHDFYYRGDELLVTHIIFNLLRNAIYAIEEVSKGEIYIWLTTGTKYNTLHFKDTSKGLQSTEKEQLFKPFYSTKKNGTGMGLSFCETVMTSFKGKINVESIPGEYTEFILHFPVCNLDSLKFLYYHIFYIIP